MDIEKPMTEEEFRRWNEESKVWGTHPQHAEEVATVATRIADAAAFEKRSTSLPHAILTLALLMASACGLSAAAPLQAPVPPQAPTRRETCKASCGQPVPQFPTRAKTCPCSTACVCSCNEGGICSCGNAPSTQYRPVPALQLQLRPQFDPGVRVPASGGWRSAPMRSGRGGGC